MTASKVFERMPWYYQHVSVQKPGNTIVLFCIGDRQRKWKAGSMCIKYYPVCRWVPVPSSSSHIHPISAGGGGCGVFGSVPAFPDKGRETLVIRWADFLWLDLSWTNASFGSNPSSLRLMGFLNGLVSRHYPNWVCFIVLIHLLQTHFTDINNADKPNQRIIQSRRGQSENIEFFFFFFCSLTF